MNTSHGEFFRIISYFLIWIEVTNASIRCGRLVHKSEAYDDRLLNLESKWTHEVSTLLNCVSICSLDELCVSFQFNEADAICAGYVVNSASSPSSVRSPGYVMFDMGRSPQTFGSSCSVDGDCTFKRHTSCVAGFCQCSTSRTGDECEGVTGVQTTAIGTQTETTTDPAAQTTTTAAQATTTAAQTTTTAAQTTTTAAQATTTAAQTTTTAAQATTTAAQTTTTAAQATTTAAQATTTAARATTTAAQTTTTAAQATTTAAQSTTTAAQATTTAAQATSTAAQATTTAAQSTTTAAQATTTAAQATTTAAQTTTTAAQATTTAAQATTTAAQSTTTEAQATTTEAQATTTAANDCGSCTVIPGIACTTNVDCIEPNSFCQGGNCHCLLNTTLVSRGTLFLCEYAQPTCGSGSNCAGLVNSACEGGVCTCSIGYNYSPISNACDNVKNCTEFLDTFTVYLGFYSFYSEDERRPGGSMQECSDMCVGSTTITCKNFEVNAVTVLIQTCYLHQTTWFEFPASVQSLLLGLFNHHQRNCDWKAVTVDTACRANVDCSPLTNAQCSAGKCACNTDHRLVPRVNKCLPFQAYGKSCVADSDCYSLLEAFCLSGVCTCRHGYSYSSTGQYCRAITECTTFKDTFTTYPNSLIFLHDIWSFPFSNPTKCKQKCIDSGIFCKSADLSSLGLCFTSAITWKEPVDDASRFDNSHTHFQRDCDWS